ncbi:putative Fe-S cluster assembly protein SufT [Vibrio metschnikovii]|uniref:Fe-S cluster assembly protein SufT n=1 Tax=Vibrio metschnikovii TaxID=28172 RepID=A0A9X0R9G3_VIBME|nr:putative Fe-S cluster assembly protein SufT [Vibrio metschnikovii]MBC5852239.1 putative Fe-S cluster assembly protein SufT [Vibrio metschnikovii]MDA3138217.1 putative Fe-S cluster assembly protein SufT [Vibrio metschnikovii]
MTQRIVNLERDCMVRRVPTGEQQVLKQGEFVTITQDLGGNYTITWRGNMYRVDGTDADAIGRKPLKLEFDTPLDDNIDKAQIYQALETVYDPEIPVNLLSLGLVYQVSVDQASRLVDIDMTLTAPGCGMGPVLVGDVEHRVSMVPNVERVNVNLVFDPPWSREMMSEEAQLETGLFF